MTIRTHVIGIATVMALSLAALAVPAAKAANSSCTDLFDPTAATYVGDQPNTYLCDVPLGTEAYAYVVRGGYGAEGAAGAPGYVGALGAKITGSIAVTPGETLRIVVAGNGLPGYVSGNYIVNSGGGGGGASSIFRAGQTVLIAGGGGGSGYATAQPFAVRGGAGGAGTPGASSGSAGSSGNYSGVDQWLTGGNGASDNTGGAAVVDGFNGTFGTGAAGGDSGNNGADSSGTGGGGGAGFDTAAGSPLTGGGTPGYPPACAAGPNGGYQGPGGYGGGGQGCFAGGGGGGLAGGGGGAGINGRGGGGGGGSSLIPAGATAVNTGTGNDRLPRVEFTAPAAPTVVGVSPAQGPTSGGTTITVTGTEFIDGGTTVEVGGQPCTNVTVLSATSLTCVTPAHAPGPVNVTVTTGGGTSAPFGSFEYVASPPTITAVSPGEVPTTGGTTVTVTGTEFSDGATVTIGGKPCTDVVVLSATQLTCVTPANPAGPADVVVTSTGGTSAPYPDFRYKNATPAVPKAPTLTRVAAGNRQLTATWTPPIAVPGVTVTGYRVVVGPGGGSCTATAAERTCTVTGLANNTEYTVRVVALTEAGDSPDSNRLTGTPRENGATGQNAKKQGQRPGTASMVVNGRSVRATRTTRNGQTTFFGNGWSLGLRPENGNGNPQIVIDRALQPERGQFVRVTADGFLPRSRARVFLFSKAYRLGVVTVEDSGSFSKRLQVPKGIPAGDHTIQVNGFSYDGAARSASLGVVIRDAAATFTRVRKTSKATVQVFPQCDAQYRVTLQRKTDSGSWRDLGTSRTRGILQTRTMDLVPGRYRAQVGKACGNPATTTESVRIGAKKPANG
jgi:IPT/TIG domain/Fibronectin type III domain